MTKSLHALVGARTGETFRLGDSVEVRLVEATPVAGGLRFEMVSSGRKGAPAGRRKRRSEACVILTLRRMVEFQTSAASIISVHDAIGSGIPRRR